MARKKSQGRSACFRNKMRIVMKENARLPKANRVAKSLAIARRHCGLPQRK